MSEASKKARADNRAKVKRLTTATTGKVDASDWTPPEPLRAGRKVYDQSKERHATAKIYKHGGKVQGDRGPRRMDKRSRHADGGVPTDRLSQVPVGKSAFMPMKSGGSADCKEMVHKHERHDHKGSPLTKLKRGGMIRTGNRSGDGYVEGTRPAGGRIARKSGGRTKGKTNIVINVGRGHDQQPQMPVQAPTRPPVMAPPPPPAPPMGGPPGMAGGPPIPPPSMAQGPMPRKRGGRTGDGKAGIDVHMTAGAGGGLGRLEKAKRYGADTR